MASTPEYYNQIIESTVTASGASELEPFIPGDNGESQPCSAERKGPYKLNTLRELVLHELHKKLKLTSKLDHQVTTHNYVSQKWTLKGLPIPSVLVKELYDQCPRHRGAYYVKVHRKLRTQVFIQPATPRGRILRTPVEEIFPPIYPLQNFAGKMERFPAPQDGTGPTVIHFQEK